jgi:hypothetical protein
MKKTKGLGNFMPKISPEQKPLFEDLFHTLLEGKLVDIPRVAILMHNILKSVLTMNTNVQHQVASALEQSLIFAMLHPTGEYRSANFLTGNCAAIQRSLFSIFVITAFLGGFEKDYALPSVKEDSQHVGDPDLEKDMEIEAEDVEEDIAELAAEPANDLADKLDSNAFPIGNTADVPLDIVDPIRQVALDSNASNLEDEIAIPFDITDDDISNPILKRVV